jgi:hypothetical protein
VNALVMRFVIKIDRAEEIAVIGHRHRRHFLLGDDLHQLFDIARAVEQRIIGMAMEVNKGAIRHVPVTLV